MTLYHVAADGATYSGACFNALIPAGEVSWRFKALLKTASWQIKQSADGITWSASDILLNATFNNDDGGPTFYQAGMNIGNVAGSINNYNAYYVVETPAGTPTALQGQFCVQHANAADAFGTYTVSFRVRFSRYGFANGSATVAPAPLVAGDERVLCGVRPGSTNTLPDPYYPWINLNTGPTGARYNMGVNSDPTNPFFWIEGHESGIATPITFSMWDSLEDLGYDAAGNPMDNGAVCFFRTSTIGSDGARASVLAQYSIVELDAEDYAGHGLGGSCGDGAQAVCAYLPCVYSAGSYVPLIYDRGALSGGLGYDSLDSSLESVLPIHYCVPNSTSVDRKGGYIGRSKNFYFTTGEPIRAHLSMGNPSGVTSYALCDNIWVPVNNGASPGLNNVALIV